MDRVFSSWKEIAAYLGKGVRTVQRWETELELPVHRPSEQGIVLAYESELQRWAQGKAERPSPPASRAPGPAKGRHADVRRRSNDLCERASKQIEILQLTLQRSRQLEQRLHTEHKSLRDGVFALRKRPEDVAAQAVEQEVELQSKSTNAA